MFRAYDAERERLVAIKLFKLDLPPERVHQLVAAFEGVIAADLQHPALAAPLATGIAGVEAYLVQDYVGADSLDLVVREYGPAAPADALRAATQLAGALDFAAAASIVHGSLHPRDILLSTDDTRLTGIGVARALAAAGITAPVRRPYSAPERIEGTMWDRRADVFSLAALVHELMWGRRIAGAGARAAENLTEIVGGDLTALRAIFARALAEDPDARFASALEFAEALQHALPGVIVAPVAPVKKRSVKKGDRATRVEPPMDVEPKLPLDTLLDPTYDSMHGADPVAPTAVSDVDLRAAESFADVVVAAPVADVEPPHAAAFEPLHTAAFESPHAADFEPPITMPAGLITGDQEPMSALERTRSAVWPIVLSLIVGAAIGFAVGYFTGARDRPSASTIAAESEGREVAKGAAVEAPPSDVGSRQAQAGSPKADAGASKPAEPSKPEPRAANPDRPAPNLGFAVGPGRLLVRSTPADATVSVDGKEYGRTPATVRDLAVGAHQVAVSRAGYATSERRIVLTRTRPVQSMQFELSRPSRAAAVPPPATPSPPASTAGALTVDSRPAGAKVYLDGKLMGNTPLSLPTVNAGEHSVRLELEGYQGWSSPVRIVAAEHNRVTASLER